MTLYPRLTGHRQISVMRYIVAALALTGCAFEPTNDEPFTPPPIYREWFQSTERCSGRRGDFDRIRWFKADMAGSGRVGHREGNTIWIDPGYLDRREVVAHEQLHVLLDGDSDHNSRAWPDCRLPKRWG
jgi:hypothetical protein